MDDCMAGNRIGRDCGTERLIIAGSTRFSNGLARNRDSAWIGFVAVDTAETEECRVDQTA